MRTAVRYRKSTATGTRSALGRGEKAALALVGAVCVILMSLWFLGLVEKAIEREAAGRAEMLRPYMEEMGRLEQEKREAELLLWHLNQSR